MNRIFSTFLLILAATSTAYSGGFQLNDHNARSVAMGFATVANITDASANYFNPACITQDPSNFSIAVGASYIMPGGKFTGPTTLNVQNTTALETWNFLIPNFYASWHSPIKNLSIGVGVFVPFGLGTRWPEDWTGRFSSVETYLETVEINPNIAYSFNIGDMPFAISAGFGYAMGNVELKKNLSTFTPEPVLDLKGTGNATTFNFSLYAQPSAKMKIGASYRHNIKMTYDGDVTYTNIKGLEALFVPGKGGATINMPNDLKFGIAYQMMENLWLEASANFVGWSSYDTLAITFDKKPGTPTTTYESKGARLYKDVIAFRLGAEYSMDENMKLRCGFGYDPMPVEPKYVEPVLPEGNRINFSLGVGYKINNMLSLDLGYMGLVAMQTETIGNPNLMDGLYNSNANIISLSLNLKF